MFRQITKCRACDYGGTTVPEGIKSADSSEALLPVLDLGIQPLANAFYKPGEDQPGYAPLKVLLCPRCKLAQLSVVVSPEVLYSQYNYITSRSATMLSHFDALWKQICERQPAPATLLEIGSNDGLFLKYAKTQGVMRVLGVDPAQNLAATTDENMGAHTLNSFWNQPTGRYVFKYHGQYDVIVARHVFCHVDDWRGFIDGLEAVSSKNTLVVIEVPYVLDMLGRGEFDTIYHEHLSYFNIGAMEWLLKDSTLKIHAVKHFPIHGGSLVVFLRHRESHVPAESMPDETITAEMWEKFNADVTFKTRKLLAIVHQAKDIGKRIACYGASAKSTVLLNACGFTRKEIDFICDNTPQKLYRLSPGTGIPITDEGALLRELPELTLLTAWNFEAEIVKKNALYIQKGGAFIVPMPEVHTTP